MVYSLRLPPVHCCAVAIAAFGLFGCSAHPLPGDFARVSTYDIVHKIRCEAAEALRGIPSGHKFLREAYIGYDFDFNITEVNNAGTLASRGKLTYTGKRPSGTLTLDVEGAAERSRQAQRTFRIIESLEQLKKATCSPSGTEANLTYPITGSIGMYEVVRTYVGLERLTTLAATPSDATAAPHEITPPRAPGGSTATPVVFSDVLVFTTKLGAGIRPTLTLVAGGVGSFKLTGASIFGDATRTDIHELTVVLARDPKTEDELPNEVFRRNAGKKTTSEKEKEFKDALRGSQAANQFTNVPNNLLLNPYSARTARTLEALEQKGQYAQTQVLIELERRKSQKEEERLATRLIEILKPGP